MSQPDFRKASWGMLAGEVASSEPEEPLLRDDETLAYPARLVGNDARAYFNFVGGRLTSAAYVIDNQHDVLDVQAFHDLHTLLVRKYGDSSPVGYERLTRLARHLPLETFGDLAEAIAQGDVEARASWQLERTFVTLTCVMSPTDPGNALVHLHYCPKDVILSMEESFEDDLDLI